MSVESDIARLNINTVLHGALLLSLFEAHPNQAGVIRSFQYYAQTIGDLALARPIPESSISAQDKAFRDMLKTLRRVARKRVQKPKSQRRA